jgi:hypothetical protein
MARTASGERFFDIIAAIIGPDETHGYAQFLGQGEATIRSWVKRINSPPTLERRRMIYEKLRLPHEVESYSEDQWRELHTHLSKSYLDLNTRISLINTLYFPGDMTRIEATINHDRSVIVFTADAEDDTGFANIKEVVRDNVAKGVRYLYVIPNDCSRTQALEKWVQTLRNLGKGSVNILITRRPHAHVEWALMDCAWFATRSDFVVTKEAVSEIDITDIHQGFEQLYKGSDFLPPDDKPATHHRRVWVRISHRRQIVFLDMLRQWSTDAAWI